VIETMFLVPERDNAGRRFSRRFWSALEDRLLAEFGGFTE